MEEIEEIENTIKLVAISGSLRQASHNTAALYAAQELLPDGVELEIADLSALPFYNEDVENAGLPEAVRVLVAQVAQADAVLIATPEYNGSIPGVLQNALDWVSRVSTGAVLRGKLVATLGASGGPSGATRAQKHLHYLLTNLRTQLLPTTVHIGRSPEKYDNAGRLTDATAREHLRTFLEAIVEQVQAQDKAEVAA